MHAQVRTEDTFFLDVDGHFHPILGWLSCVFFTRLVWNSGIPHCVRTQSHAHVRAPLGSMQWGLCAHHSNLRKCACRVACHCEQVKWEPAMHQQKRPLQTQQWLPCTARQWAPPLPQGSAAHCVLSPEGLSRHVSRCWAYHTAARGRGSAHMRVPS